MTSRTRAEKRVVMAAMRWSRWRELMPACRCPECQIIRACAALARQSRARKGGKG